MTISALEAAKLIDELDERIAALVNGAALLRDYTTGYNHQAQLLEAMAEEFKRDKTKLENRLKELFI
jgi:hypothetical protein